MLVIPDAKQGKDRSVTDIKATEHRLLGFVLSLCMLLTISISSLIAATSSSQAQSSAAPLDLGTIIQKESPRPAPTYLKLPETIPIPANNPLKTPERTGDADNAQAAPSEPAGAASTEKSTPEATTEEATSDTVTQAADAPMDSDEDALTAIDPMYVAPDPNEPVQPEAPQIEPGGIAKLELTALLSDDGQVLQRGINWRIFGDQRDQEGHLPMLHNVDGGPLELDLEPGSYIVYAGYGYANLTKRIILPKAGSYSESFNLHAGAMRLNAVAAGDIALDDNILKFDIYSNEDSDTGSHSLLVNNVKPNHVVKLSQGTYHVVSNYGSSNAKVRGDVEITEGKLINVTMIHNAAKVTLRLVSEPGGEALANTIWTVFTPGGDVVKRAIGAFPTLALAAGDYTAIAKQGNEVYNRDFSVTAGLNRDIEVLSTAQ